MTFKSYCPDTQTQTHIVEWLLYRYH